jgi:hypothetical protein
MLVELDAKTYINVLQVSSVKQNSIERAIVDKNSVGQLINTRKDSIDVVDIFLVEIEAPLQVEGVSAKEVVDVINKGLLFYQGTLPMKAFLMVKVADSYFNLFNIKYIQDGELEEDLPSKNGVVNLGLKKKIPGVEIGGTDVFIKGMTAKELAELFNHKFRGAVEKE